MAPRYSPPPDIADELIVVIHPGVDANHLWSDYDLVSNENLPDGVTYLTRYTGTGRLSDVQMRLLADPRVGAAQENLPVSSPVFKQSSFAFDEGNPTASGFWDQKLTSRLGLGVAHENSRGRGVRVAILDTGIDMNHPALADRILPESWDFVDGDGDPSDLPNGIDDNGDGQIDEATGHGTHVAGLVALVAPAARILALRVLNSDGQGNAYAVANAMMYAMSQGCRIINLSVRMSSASLAVDRAISLARDRGIVVVVAAGNDPSLTAPDYPASNPYVWPVAAVNEYDTPASFTSAYPAVVLSAPGNNLLSTYWDDHYAVWSGTSMAAPIVSGTAALLLAQNPELTPAEVLSRLQSTAIPYKSSFPGMGAGVVSPRNAILGNAGPRTQTESTAGYGRR